MKAYSPKSEGVREWNPRPGRPGAVVLTQRLSPSIKTVRGWLLPLEHYDRDPGMSVLQQYLELLLVMASKRPVDVPSMRTVLRQARSNLDDAQYEILLTYRPMFDVGGTVVRR